MDLSHPQAMRSISESELDQTHEIAPKAIPLRLRQGAPAAWAILGLVQLGAILSTARVGSALELRLWGGTAAVALCGLGLRRLRAVRAARFALALARSWSAMLLVLSASVYLTPWTGPLQDRVLAWPDGGRVGVMAADLLARSGAWSWAVVGYDSGQLALVLVLAWLAWTGAPFARMARIADGFVVCGVLGLLVYLAAPAAGPQLHGVYLGCAAGGQPGWSAMRAGLPVWLVDGIPGYIACPSYHAVAATLLARAVWSSPAARPIAVGWWLVLVGTAWTVGGHYVLDLVAGTSLALTAWKACR